MLNVLICCLAFSLQENDSILIVNAKDNLEWYYIVPSDRLGNKHQFVFGPDNWGVMYLDRERFQAIKKLKILRNGIDITNEVKFFTRTDHDLYKDGKYEKYQLVKFFIPIEEKPRCCPGADWSDPEVYYEYSKEEQRMRQRLIEEGRIKF